MQAIALGQWRFPVGESHLAAIFTEAPTDQAELYSPELMRKLWGHGDDIDLGF